MLKQLSCQDWILTSLNDFIGLNEGILCKVGISSRGTTIFISLADNLNAREKLTEVMNVCLSDQVVHISCVIDRSSTECNGGWSLGFVDEVARLLAHDHAVVDQVAQFGDLFTFQHLYYFRF